MIVLERLVASAGSVDSKHWGGTSGPFQGQGCLCSFSDEIGADDSARDKWQ